MMPIRIEQLTGLRFIAALGVLFAHFSALLPTLGSIKFLSTLGGHGVLLFFVLSGFVLTMRHDDCVVDMRKYAIARFARIAPVYWLMLGVTALVYLMNDSAFALGPRSTGFVQSTLSLIANSLAIQAWIPSIHYQEFWNAPGWSISAEFFFYACLPLLLKIRWLDGSARSYFLAIIIFTLVILLYFGWVFLFIPPDVKSIFFSFAARLPLFEIFPFILGVLTCRLWKKNFLKGEGDKYGFLTSLFFVLIGAVAWLVEVGELSIHTRIVVWYFVYAPLFAGLIFAISINNSFFCKILSSKIMVLLGNASYPLYLIHYLPLGALLYFLGYGGVSLELVMVIILGLIVTSIIIHLLFEVPIRNYIIRVLL